MKKVPKGKKVLRSIEFKLTEQQKAAKGEAAAKTADDLTCIEAEFLKMKTEFNATIKKIKATLNKFLREIHKGVETRDVEAIEVKNFDKNEVEYWFEGKMVEKRDMNEEDRQLELEEHAAKKTKTQKGKRITMKGKKALADEEGPSDVQQVIKEQTNKKTAHSSVNP